MKTESKDHYVAAGAQSDFENLLGQFIATNSVRYEEFSACWCRAKMQFIFAGRDDKRELRHFILECMRIVCDMWMPPREFQTCVGCLYLLYALFFKQPLEPKVKIRVTVKQWSDIMAFMADVRQQQHYDVEHIFLTLRWVGAFQFVARSEPLCLEGFFGYTANKVSEETVMKDATALIMQKSIMSGILEPDNIAQLSAIHEQYHRMKCKLNGPDASKPSVSLNVIQENLVQYITKAVTGHEEWRKTGGDKGKKKKRDSGVLTTTSESEADSDSEYNPYSPKKKRRTTYERRSEIKERAFSQLIASPSGSRVHETMTESEDEWSGSPVKQNSGHGRASRGRGRGRGRGRKSSFVEKEVNNKSLQKKKKTTKKSKKKGGDEDANSTDLFGQFFNDPSDKDSEMDVKVSCGIEVKSDSEPDMKDFETDIAFTFDLDHIKSDGGDTSQELDSSQELDMSKKGAAKEGESTHQAKGGRKRKSKGNDPKGKKAKVDDSDDWIKVEEDSDAKPTKKKATRKSKNK